MPQCVGVTMEAFDVRRVMAPINAAPSGLHSCMVNHEYTQLNKYNVLLIAKMYYHMQPNVAVQK